MLVLSLIYLLLSDSNYKPTIAVEKTEALSAYYDELKDEDVKLKDLPETGLKDPNQYLIDNRKVDLLVKEYEGGGFDLYMLEASTKGKKAAKLFQDAVKVVVTDQKQENIDQIKELADAMKSISGMVSPPEAVMNALPDLESIEALQTDFDVNIHTVFGSEDSSVFDMFGFVFLGFFPFFLIFLLAGFTLVRERSGGTLERFLMSPIKRRDVILGYTIGYSVFAVIQAILVVAYTVYVLKLACEGSIFWVMLTMVMMAVVAVSFGSLVSIFSTTELQVVQIVPVAVIPQVFFSGLIPLDTIPYGLGNLCYLTPVYYGCTAIKKVMVEGGGIGAIWPFLLGLVVFTCVLGFLNTRALKKYRTL